jgi:glucose-1-phosphate cytidylyltransferase
MAINQKTKAVILCGGQGTRIRDVSENLPKPLIPIGSKPILWHIMKIYYAQGIKNFVLCLGYKGEDIRDFFLNYKHYISDITVSTKDNEIIVHPKNDSEDWNITLVNTGETTNTAKRLYLVRKYIEHDPYFMLTYGDGVSDIDLNRLFELHRELRQRKQIVGTITGVNPLSKYGEVKSGEDELISSFVEKPVLRDSFVNGGFMVFDAEFLRNPMLKEDIPIEAVLEKLSEHGKIALYRHYGFWHSMDTQRDFHSLNELWKSGEPPWKTW